MSHTLLILKIFTTFKDVQMILKQFFDISTGFRFSKMQWGSVPSIPVAVLAQLDHPSYKGIDCHLSLAICIGCRGNYCGVGGFKTTYREITNIFQKVFKLIHDYAARFYIQVSIPRLIGKVSIWRKTKAVSIFTISF